MITPEKEILGRWLSLRDAEAFAQIVHRHAGMVYATCRRILGDEAEAEDVTQQCFLAFTLSAARGMPDYLGPWLHGMATNKCLMHVRSGRRGEQEAPTANRCPPARDCVAEAEWDDIRTVVDELLCELPDVLRVPIVMHFLSGLGHTEIAAELGVPRRTVSSRIEQGLATLTQMLNKRGVKSSGAALAILLATNIDPATAAPGALLPPLERLGAVHSAPGAVNGFPLTKVLLTVVLAALALALAGLALNPFWRTMDPATPPVALETVAVVTQPDEVPSSSTEQDNAPERSGLIEGLAGALATGAVSGTVYDDSIAYHPQRLAGFDLAGGSNEEFERALLHVAHKPLPGIVVTATSENGRHVTTTDAAGKYAFAPLAAGPWTIRAERPANAVADGDKTVTLTLKIAEERADIDFAFRFDGVSVTGRVTDAGGAPIPGASVTARHHPEWQGESNTIVANGLVTVTGDDGAYRIDGLLPMDILSGAAYRRDGVLPERGVYAVSVRSKGHETLEIIVPCISPALVGHVDVFLEFADLARAQNGQDDYIPGARPGLIPAGHGETLTGIDFRLKTSGSVAGNIVDTDKQAVSGARVWMVLADDGALEKDVLQPYPLPPESVETGADGDFLVENVSPGRYEFRVARGDSRAQETRNPPLEIAPGQHITGLELLVESLRRRANITGVIVDALTGRPVKQAAVRVIQIVSAHEPNPVHGSVSVDAESGVFDVAALSPGTVDMRVWAESYCVFELIVETLPGQTHDVVVPLMPGGVIEGRMTYAGEGTAGCVSARRADGAELPTPNDYRDSGRSAYPRETGVYRLDTLPPGEYYVQASANVNRETNRIEWVRATVEPGLTTHLDIDIEPAGGVIQGQIAFPGVYRKARIVVLEGDVAGLDFGFEYWQRMRSDTGETIRESGSYRIESLPPGTYTLRAHCYSRTDGIDLAEQPVRWAVVTLDDGQTLEQDFELTDSAVD